jgi:nitrogen fixation protein NifB
VLELDDVSSYIEDQLGIYPDCKVVGIAGPGDPLSNPKETFGALDIISKNYPDIKKCLCTNGFGVQEYAEMLNGAKLDYITLTINAVNPNTLSQIYSYTNYKGTYYYGEDAGLLIKELQQFAMDFISTIKGIKIKINIVLIPNVNDQELDELIKHLSRYPIDVINIMPFIPVPGTKFEHTRTVTSDEIDRIRDCYSKQYQAISFKRDCRRCRADACGLL